MGFNLICGRYVLDSSILEKMWRCVCPRGQVSGG